MSKCILRVAKINNQGSATGKTSHNYRLVQVPNADPQRTHLNKEYLNEGEKNIWELANQRIKQAGIKGVRKDAVRGMEFLMTASPNAFKRDNAGVITDDYRGTSWVIDNLKFLQEKYGANLVSFTLHQDEKTPHIHAVVVPITSDGRLSAKELFNPKSLRNLQTDYAKAMNGYNLERGIEGSRTRHQTMKQIYGLQQQTKQTLDNTLKSLQEPPQPLIIEKPGALDLLNLERWRQEQQNRVNAEYAHQLELIRKEAQNAQNAAIANAASKEQTKVLQQRLETSESLKQDNYAKAQKLEQSLTKRQINFEKLAILADEGRINKESLRKLADGFRAKAMIRIEADLLETLKKPLTTPKEVYDRITKRGYELDSSKGYPVLVDPRTATRVDLTSMQLKGTLFIKLVQSRIEETQKKNQEDKQQQKRSRGLGL